MHGIGYADHDFRLLDRFDAGWGHQERIHIQNGGIGWSAVRDLLRLRKPNHTERDRRTLCLLAPVLVPRSLSFVSCPLGCLSISHGSPWFLFCFLFFFFFSLS